MAKITAITAQVKNKDRCNIYLDGIFKSGVPIDAVYNYSLKVGDEIDDEKIAKILFESTKLEAYNKAVNYVSRALKTKKQLKDYLFGKGYTDEVVNYVIDKLIEIGLINDVEYVYHYLQTYSSKEGKNLSECKLFAKGISKKDIEKGFETVEIFSKENAFNVLQKYMKNKEITSENLAKAYRYLLSKGFLYDEVSSAIEKLKEN